MALKRRTARGISSKGLEQVLPFDTLVPGHGAKDRVQRSNSQVFMCGHSQALMRGGFGLKYNVTPLLVNNAAVPVSTKQVGKVLPAQVASKLHPLAKTSSRTRCSRMVEGRCGWSK